MNAPVGGFLVIELQDITEHNVVTLFFIQIRRHWMYVLMLKTHFIKSKIPALALPLARKGEPGGLPGGDTWAGAPAEDD